MGIIKIKRYSYLSFLLLAITGSCVEPYEPAVVKEDKNFLVVDGFLNTTTGTVTARVTRTLPLYTEGEVTIESRAMVNLESQDGDTYKLADHGNGWYEQNNLVIDTEKQYRLHLHTSDNQEYFSEFVTVKNSPPIDSVFWLPENDGIRIYVNTHDDSGNTRYYKWTYYETWEYNSVFSSTVKFISKGVIVPRPIEEYINRCWAEDISDNVLVGSTVKLEADIISHFPLLFLAKGRAEIRKRYSILVKQQAITKEAYEYWLQVQQTNESLGTLFDPLPYQIGSNLYNATDPSQPVLGYFSGGSVEEKRIFINAHDLPDNFWFYPPSDCAYDTIMIQDIGEFDERKLLVASYGYPILEGYLSSDIFCIDCRTQGGTTTKPSFWGE